MDLEMQLDLLGVALDALGKDGELINQVLEITLGGATEAEISVLRYEYTSMK
jgi:hypothetical protein